MVIRIDYPGARNLLEDALQASEQLFAEGHTPPVGAGLHASFDVVFDSPTQAYREALLGCIIARILDKDADIRLPYASQGDRAFNARSLDEEVINPFVKQNEIPSSKGPYLNVFRRQVQFNEATRDGLRDKSGYDAFLSILGYIEQTADSAELMRVLIHAVYRFVVLREQSTVELARIQRISLRQYERLLDTLLKTPSGGLMPVLIVESMLQTIRETFSLQWEIEVQGINVSDRSTGAGGDIVVRKQGALLMGMEITERPVDEARVISTFRTKIAPGGIADYVFMVNLHSIPDAAMRQADQYFAQGHDVNFVDIRSWAYNSLVTVGQLGRSVFNQHLQAALTRGEVPNQIKVAWNTAITEITSV